MSQITLRAETGRAPGSRESRRIRRSGLIPAVVYGLGMEPVAVAVDSRELHAALHTEAGSNAIINLEIEGGDTVTAMARVVEKHPFRNEYRHIDFLKVDLTKKIITDVAIHFEGDPVGVREGGVFSPAKTTVSIEVLVTDIPSFIEIDVSEVEMGGSLRVADLPAISGLEYLDDPEAVVMSVTAPAVEVEEPVEGEEVEGEAAADESADAGEGEDEADESAEAEGEGGAED